MKLKSVEFYQSVRLWDNREAKTVDLNNVSSIELNDHLVELRMDGQEEVIIIPTANMRHGRIQNYIEELAPGLKQAKVFLETKAKKNK